MCNFLLVLAWLTGSGQKFANRLITETNMQKQFFLFYLKCE